MATRKFYSNKAKAGWRDNPSHTPPERLSKGEKQKEHQKKYYSWGYDIDLETEEWDPETGKPKRNRRREAGFESRGKADAAAARLKYSEKEEKYNLKKQPFPGIVEVLQKGLERLLSKKERVRAKTIFNRWLELLDCNLRIDELRTSHLNIYVQDRRGKVADGSINREINNIASALHNAHEDFPILERWICPRIPRLKVKRSRRERLITRIEINLVFNFLFHVRTDDESIREYENRRVVGQAFQMALLTGARIGEIAAMRWEHIDWGEKILQIHGTKTQYVSASTVRYLELTPSMEDILLIRQQLDMFGEYVFSRTGNSITYYHRIMKDAAGRAGIAYGKNKEGAFITHDARHTAVTRMLQGGVDLSTIGSITGHSDKTLILHYSHATRESRRVAGRVLDDFAMGDESENQNQNFQIKKA